MRRKVWALAAAAVTVATTVAALAPAAASAAEPSRDGWLECVPFARELSGVRIFGNALTWWDQAKAHYARGSLPQPGAVMAFRPHGAMQLGHVAVVRRVVNSREVRLDHSNWSLIDGRRGQIERDVRAIDVSPANDWSRVRVWYAPIQSLGGTQWPLSGFIYPDKPVAAPKPFRLELPADLAKMELPKAGARMARIGRVLAR